MEHSFTLIEIYRTFDVIKELPCNNNKKKSLHTEDVMIYQILV